jgi:hypothetical protein
MKASFKRGQHVEHKAHGDKRYATWKAGVITGVDADDWYEIRLTSGETCFSSSQYIRPRPVIS